MFLACWLPKNLAPFEIFQVTDENKFYNFQWGWLETGKKKGNVPLTSFFQRTQRQARVDWQKTRLLKFPMGCEPSLPGHKSDALPLAPALENFIFESLFRLFVFPKKIPISKIKRGMRSSLIVFSVSNFKPVASERHDNKKVGSDIIWKENLYIYLPLCERFACSEIKRAWGRVRILLVWCHCRVGVTGFNL